MNDTPKKLEELWEEAWNEIEDLIKLPPPKPIPLVSYPKGLLFYLDYLKGFPPKHFDE